MNRLPLTDQLPYRFYPPRFHPVCLWVGRRVARGMVRKQHRVEAVEFRGEEHLRPLLGQGDGLLLAPNHTDHADSFMMFELSRRLGRPFYFMAAYQIFQGRSRWFLPRLGVFPVDREGADLTAFKTAVDLLARGGNPLVVFPEGEIYRLGDRLTPLREGALALAATAAKRLAGVGRTVRVVPIGIKYRFLDGHDPTPALHAVLDELERRNTWWVRRDRSLLDRLYHYAEGMMGLKEFEYFGEPQRGKLPDRLAALRAAILERLEAKRLPPRTDQHRERGGAEAAPLSVPERVKALRRACLDELAKPDTAGARALELRHDLHDVFVAAQTFSYPGDYVLENPTLERVAETLLKFEEDFLGVPEVRPKGPRRAVVQVGEPIDLAERLAGFAKPRLAVSALTAELETRMQGLLDAIGPGRPLATTG